MRSIDQYKPVARTRVGNRGIVGNWPGKHWIALDQMHGDDSVELFGIELIPQCGAQFVFGAGKRAEADNAKCRTAALSSADRDARDRADHVLETRQRSLRPIGGVLQRGVVGGAVEDVESPGGGETEIFRRALMGDIAP